MAVKVTGWGLVKLWPDAGVDRVTIGTTAGVGVVRVKGPVMLPPPPPLPLSIITL